MWNLNKSVASLKTTKQTSEQLPLQNHSYGYGAAAAKLLQSCSTLFDPIDSRPPVSSVPGILQARILEWVAISFSNAWDWKVKVKVKSCLTLCDPMDCSLPGSSFHGIFQTRVLEWVAIAFSYGHEKQLSVTWPSLLRSLVQLGVRPHTLTPQDTSWENLQCLPWSGWDRVGFPTATGCPCPQTLRSVFLILPLSHHGGQELLYGAASSLWTSISWATSGQKDPAPLCPGTLLSWVSFPHLHCRVFTQEKRGFSPTFS